MNRLVQSDRIQLKPGQRSSVTLHVTQQELSWWPSVGQKWLVVTGTRIISLGSSSRDM